MLGWLRLAARLGLLAEAGNERIGVGVTLVQDLHRYLPVQHPVGRFEYVRHAPPSQVGCQVVSSE